MATNLVKATMGERRGAIALLGLMNRMLAYQRNVRKKWMPSVLALRSKVCIDFDLAPVFDRLSTVKTSSNEPAREALKSNKGKKRTTPSSKMASHQPDKNEPGNSEVVTEAVS